MGRLKLLFLTSLAMVAFAANSLLCREALKHTPIDPATFSSARILSGALALWLIVRLRHGSASAANHGTWLSAVALFGYVAGFSFAYVGLSAATGALILFGSVQATMISYGIWKGERLKGGQMLGLVVAFAGLVFLMMPGLASPSRHSSLLMLAAGVSWGVYSLRGKGAGNPTQATAGNFLRAVPFTLILSAFLFSSHAWNMHGLMYAAASGALASGVGYAIWYAALQGLKLVPAAAVQLSVPVLAAAGGVLFLGEGVTLRLLIASVATLGGIALVILGRGAGRRR
jgi:drug/metabolite transporter (DMT)-like permease